MITSTLSGTTLNVIKQDQWAQLFSTPQAQSAREKVLSAPTQPWRGRGIRVHVSLEPDEAEEFVTALDDIAGYGESQHNLPLEQFSLFQAVRRDSLRWAELFS